MLYSSVCSLCSFTFETMPQVLLLLVSKRPRTFVTVIMQIRTFSLNLGTYNKNFEAIEDSLGRSFQKELKYILKGIKKKKISGNFSEKHCVVTLILNTTRFLILLVQICMDGLSSTDSILNKLLKIILHIRHRI